MQHLFVPLYNCPLASLFFVAFAHAALQMFPTCSLPCVPWNFPPVPLVPLYTNGSSVHCNAILTTCFSTAVPCYTVIVSWLYLLVVPYTTWLFSNMIVLSHFCSLQCINVSYRGWLQPWFFQPWLLPAMIVCCHDCSCYDCFLPRLFPPMIVPSSIIDWFPASLFSAALSLQFVPCNGFTGFAHCSSFLLILVTTVPVYACFILFSLLG
jgi:hypothetical protein